MSRKKRRRLLGQVSKYQEIRSSPSKELRAKSQERFIAAGDVTRRTRNLKDVQEEKNIFEKKKKFCLEEEEKLCEEKCCRRKKFCRRGGKREEQVGGHVTLDGWPDDAIKELRNTAFVNVVKLMEQEDVEDVQGVLARDGRKELVTKNNIVVTLIPAREVGVMNGDVEVVDFAEPKVNLATLDEVSDSTDRGLAASEKTILEGRAIFGSTLAIIRDTRRRITDRLRAVNDVTVLQRAISKIEKILNEGIDNQLEKKKIVKSTITGRVLKEDLGDQSEKKEVIGSMIKSGREDTFEPLRELLDTCMQRCGPLFVSEVGKFRFLNEMIKLVSPKYLGTKTSISVRDKQWIISFPRETKIKEAYDMLKKQGVIKDDHCNFINCSGILNQSNKIKNPIFDDEEKAKLLQNLLKSKNPSDLHAANRLIKTMVRE
ncbi:hypothetical protein TSAR_014765, partial [Trichomalopsis sarcophagae]